MRDFFMLVGLVGIQVGCSESHPRDARLEYGSVEDVRAVLSSGGARSLPLACANVRHSSGEVIRSIACGTTIPSDTLATLVNTLPLSVGPASNAGMRDACETRPGLRSTDPGVAVLVGKNTRVRNGVGRVEIHVVSETGAACVEITYPWG